MFQFSRIYSITPYKLAATTGIFRSTMHRWTYEVSDPLGDSILQIRDALEAIDPAAAEAFVNLYLGRSRKGCGAISGDS